MKQFLDTVLTLIGDYDDPSISLHVDFLVIELLKILSIGKNEFRVKTVEPWNSVRVTFNIPRNAALRLRQLAISSQERCVLRDLGILTVQIQGENVIPISNTNENISSNESIVVNGSQVQRDQDTYFYDGIEISGDNAWSQSKDNVCENGLNLPLNESSNISLANTHPQQKMVNISNFTAYSHSHLRTSSMQNYMKPIPNSNHYLDNYLMEHIQHPEQNHLLNPLTYQNSVSPIGNIQLDSFMTHDIIDAVGLHELKDLKELEPSDIINEVDSNLDLDNLNLYKNCNGEFESKRNNLVQLNSYIPSNSYDYNFSKPLRPNQNFMQNGKHPNYGEFLINSNLQNKRFRNTNFANSSSPPNEQLDFSHPNIGGLNHSHNFSNQHTLFQKVSCYEQLNDLINSPFSVGSNFGKKFFRVTSNNLYTSQTQLPNNFKASYSNQNVTTNLLQNDTYKLPKNFSSNTFDKILTNAQPKYPNNSCKNIPLPFKSPINYTMSHIPSNRLNVVGQSTSSTTTTTLNHHIHPLHMNFESSENESFSNNYHPFNPSTKLKSNEYLNYKIGPYLPMSNFQLNQSKCEDDNIPTSSNLNSYNTLSKMGIIPSTYSLFKYNGIPYSNLEGNQLNPPVISDPALSSPLLVNLLQKNINYSSVGASKLISPNTCPITNSNVTSSAIQVCEPPLKSHPDASLKLGNVANQPTTQSNLFFDTCGSIKVENNYLKSPCYPSFFDHSIVPPCQGGGNNTTLNNYQTTNFPTYTNCNKKMSSLLITTTTSSALNKTDLFIEDKESKTLLDPQEIYKFYPNSDTNLLTSSAEKLINSYPIYPNINNCNYLKRSKPDTVEPTTFPHPFSPLVSNAGQASHKKRKRYAKSTFNNDPISAKSDTFITYTGSHIHSTTSLTWSHSHKKSFPHPKKTDDQHKASVGSVGKMAATGSNSKSFPAAPTSLSITEIVSQNLAAIKNAMKNVKASITTTSGGPVNKPPIQMTYAQHTASKVMAKNLTGSSSTTPPIASAPNYNCPPSNTFARTSSKNYTGSGHNNFVLPTANITDDNGKVFSLDLTNSSIHQYRHGYSPLSTPIQFNPLLRPKIINFRSNSQILQDVQSQIFINSLNVSGENRHRTEDYSPIPELHKTPNTIQLQSVYPSTFFSNKDSPATKYSEISNTITLDTFGPYQHVAPTTNNNDGIQILTNESTPNIRDNSSNDKPLTFSPFGKNVFTDVGFATAAIGQPQATRKIYNPGPQCQLLPPSSTLLQTHKRFETLDNGIQPKCCFTSSDSVAQKESFTIETNISPSKELHQDICFANTFCTSFHTQPINLNQHSTSIPPNPPNIVSPSSVASPNSVNFIKSNTNLSQSVPSPSLAHRTTTNYNSIDLPNFRPVAESTQDLLVSPHHLLHKKSVVSRELNYFTHTNHMDNKIKDDDEVKENWDSPFFQLINPIIIEPPPPDINLICKTSSSSSSYKGYNLNQAAATNDNSKPTLSHTPTLNEMNALKLPMYNGSSELLGNTLDHDDSIFNLRDNSIPQDHSFLEEPSISYFHHNNVGLALVEEGLEDDLMVMDDGGAGLIDTAIVMNDPKNDPFLSANIRIDKDPNTFFASIDQDLIYNISSS